MNDRTTLCIKAASNGWTAQTENIGRHKVFYSQRGIRNRFTAYVSVIIGFNRGEKTHWLAFDSDGDVLGMSYVKGSSEFILTDMYRALQLVK